MIRNRAFREIEEALFFYIIRLERRVFMDSYDNDFLFLDDDLFFEEEDDVDTV